MTYVLTLILNAEAAALDGPLLERIRKITPKSEAPVWLAKGVAADVAFNPADIDLKDLNAAVLSALDGAPVDFAIQPIADRRKRLLIADMDSTMIQQEGIDELAEAAGVRAEVSAVTERAMRGELDFIPSLRARVALLKGLPRAVVEHVAATRITLTPGARTLVRTMRAHGAYAALVSGGYTMISSGVAARIGFDEHRANTLLFDDDDKLTGDVADPVLGREEKLDALNALRRHFDLQAAQTLAVGDGANDLAMIRAAGLGVAYRAKPSVAAAADARIDHGDLTALLYLQGYRREEFLD